MKAIPALSDREPIRKKQVQARAAAFVRLKISSSEYLRISGLSYPLRLEAAVGYAATRASALVATGLDQGAAMKTAAWDAATALGVRRTALIMMLRA